MKIRLMISFAVLVLLSLFMPVEGFFQAYADDEGQQPIQARPIIDPYLDKMLAGMSPSDNISVLVYLKGDPTLDRKIQDIWAYRPDDEMYVLSESLREKQRKVSKEMRPDMEQIRAGDPATLQRYKELEEKYGLTKEYTDAVVKRINELHDAKVRQITALQEQAYARGVQQAKQQIELLPDTVVTSATIIFNSLAVETKVSNIDALAAIPNIVKIYEDAKGMPAIAPYLGINLLSPNNGSLNLPVKSASFSWETYKDSTKYKVLLAKDAAMTQVVGEAQVTTNAYEYDGTLDYGTNYFWRVMALEPAPSDWSYSFSFQTEAAPAQPEIPAQYSYWPAILLVVALIALATGAGLISWFIIVKRQKAKS